MKIIIAILALSTVACSSIPTNECDTKRRMSLGVNFDESTNWKGGPNATFELIEQCDKVFFGARHVSHWFSGRPFNDREETWYNEAVIGIEF